MPSTSLFSLWSFYARHRQDRWKICYYVTVWREKRRDSRLSEGALLHVIWMALSPSTSRGATRVETRFIGFSARRRSDRSLLIRWFDISSFPEYAWISTWNFVGDALDYSLGLQLQRVNRASCITRDAVKRALHRANLQTDDLAAKLLGTPKRTRSISKLFSLH